MKFYAKYGGTSSIQPGFSLGFMVDTPNRMLVSYENEGILFFIDESDEWYFDGHDLYVDYNENLDEIHYLYKR